MFRYLNALLAVVALGALPALSGCLGGGGGGSTAAPAAQMPREPAPTPAPRARAEPTPEPEPAPEPKAEPEPQAPARRAAPAPAPAAKPATRADLWENAGWVWSHIGSESGSTENIYPYDRQGSWASEPVAGLTSPWVITSDTNSHHVAEPLLAGKPGFGMTRYYRAEEDRIPVFESSGGALTDIGTDGAVFGRTVWDDGSDDNGRWSAWGWWLEYRAGDFIANAPGRAHNPWRQSIPVLGVFVDAPEFRVSPASLPETGSATYRGPAMGVFASHLGEVDSVGFVKSTDSYYGGEFTGSAEITMTYPGTGTLADHVTNVRISRMDGSRRVGNSGPWENVVQEFDPGEGPAFRWEGYVTSISNPDDHSGGADGRYLSASSSLEQVSGLGDVSTANTLIGNAGNSLSLAFSNVEGAGGNPRNIGGLFMVRAHQTNKHDHFMGVFLAPLVTP